MIKQLFIDIETAPYEAYVWRTGKQFVSHNSLKWGHRDGNIICVCYKWGHEKKVHHIEWNQDGDKELIKSLVPVLLEADEIIAQNGDRFDIPYINTRIVANKLEATPIWKTADTLIIARKRFRCPSNRLDALGQFLLGEGKMDTNFGMWVDIKENDCPKAMAKMVKYCKKDVVLLQRVYEEIAGFHRPKTHVGVATGGEKWTCAYCGSQEVKKHKTTYTAAGTKQHQMQCTKCHRYYTISHTAFVDYNEWRNDQREKQRGK
jgi:hypothetical protein